MLNPGVGKNSAGHGVQAVAFSPDGSKVAVASLGIVVYEISPRRLRCLPGHGFMTSAVAFDPARPVLATASRSQDVTFWDLETGREFQRQTGLPGLRGNLVFNANGSLLAAAPFARFATSWTTEGLALLDCESGQIRKTFPGKLTSAVAFDPSGRWLAAGDQHGHVWLWDSTTGEFQKRWPVANGWITDVAFIRNGSHLVIGDVGGLIVIWDLEHNRAVSQSTLPAGLIHFTIDPQERLLAVLNCLWEVRILDLGDLHVLSKLERHDEPAAVAMAFRNDGKWLAIGGFDRRVTIWDTRTFEKAFALPTLSSPILDLAFQPGGSRLAVATADEFIPLWDFAGLESDLKPLRLMDDSAAGETGKQDLPVARSIEYRRFVSHDQISLGFLNWLAEHCLDTNPDQPQVAMQLAWFRVNGPKAYRDADAALPLALLAVERAPNEALCLNTLGVVYYRLGRWNEAIQTLQTAAKLNPDGANCYDLLFLAMSYQQQGQSEKAAKHFDQAMKLWSGFELDDQEATELSGILDEAKLVLRGEADPPASAEDQMAAAQGYVDMGRWNMAARHFRRAALLAPDDPVTWDKLGRTHAAPQRVAGGRRMLRAGHPTESQ